MSLLWSVEDEQTNRYLHTCIHIFRVYMYTNKFTTFFWLLGVMADIFPDHDPFLSPPIKPE